MSYPGPLAGFEPDPSFRGAIKPLRHAQVPCLSAQNVAQINTFIVSVLWASIAFFSFVR
jgi:hypothetical protein